MNKALYDNNGYYYKKPIGTKDFVTSPEICQIFGEIIGLYLYFLKNKINSKFNFIELGPGNGTLFVDIVRSVAKNKFSEC